MWRYYGGQHPKRLGKKVEIVRVLDEATPHRHATLLIRFKDGKLMIVDRWMIEEG